MLTKPGAIHQSNYFTLFKKNEQGAILISFMIILPFFIALMFISFEIAHYLQRKAKLSDAIEQATLALTIENNEIPDEPQQIKNNALVLSYANAYLPSKEFSAPIININDNTSHIEYSATVTMAYPTKFLSRSPLTNSISNINTTDNGVAIKNKAIEASEPTDVVFVADYSESMEWPFPGGDTSRTKIEELRDIFQRLNIKIKNNSNIHTIGFIPFSWGTKIKDNQSNEYCHFPFVPKKHKPDGSYFREYIASELKKVPGLESLDIIRTKNGDENINDIEYAKFESEESFFVFKEIEKKVKLDNVFNANKLRRRIASIRSGYTQMDIIGEMIDYDETIRSISDDITTIDIPLNDIINKDICLNHSNAYSLEGDDIIDNIIEMSASGTTLISSGILAANNLFRKKNNSANKKLMIILSDGNDGRYTANSESIYAGIPFKEESGNYITADLIDMGMCEEIQKNNITMVFIAIGYEPHGIDWKKCVGKGNYYQANNTHQLEQSLQQALGSTNSSEVGRSMPKR
ncbi:pilus assembly protein [Yersinia enterocolitica]